MNTLTYELPLSEKVTSSSPAVGDRSRATTKKKVHARTIVQGYNDQTEYTEIDPFTGRIRTIRHH